MLLQHWAEEQNQTALDHPDVLAQRASLVQTLHAAMRG
jgi:hypothetical protein